MGVPPAVPPEPITLVSWLLSAQDGAVLALLWVSVALLAIPTPVTHVPCPVVPPGHGGALSRWPNLEHPGWAQRGHSSDNGGDTMGGTKWAW